MRVKTSVEEVAVRRGDLEMTSRDGSSGRSAVTIALERHSDFEQETLHCKGPPN